MTLPFHLNRLAYTIGVFHLAMFTLSPLNTPAVAQDESAEPQASVAQSEVLYEVMQLKYLEADKAIQLLESLMEGQESLILQSDAVTNTLVVRGTEEDLSAVRKFIADMDQVASSEQSLVRIFYVKHVKAELAFEVLEEVLRDSPGVRMAVDTRLNALIIKASEKEQESVVDVLELIDRPEDEHTITETRSAKSMGAQSEAQKLLVEILAKDEGVVADFIPELDAMVLRGNKEDVEKFETTIQQILAQTTQAGPEESVGSYLVRIQWLLSKGYAADTSQDPPGLEQIREQARSLGIENLHLTGQLMATVSPIDGLGDFMVSGEVDLSADEPSGEMEVPLQVQGTLAVVDSNKEILALSIAVQAGNANTEVDIQLEANKAIVIGGMPMSHPKSHSLFVVEVRKN